MQGCVLQLSKLKLCFPWSSNYLSCSLSNRSSWLEGKSTVWRNQLDLNDKLQLWVQFTASGSFPSVYLHVDTSVFSLWGLSPSCCWSLPSTTSVLLTRVPTGGFVLKKRVILGLGAMMRAVTSSAGFQGVGSAAWRSVVGWVCDGEAASSPPALLLPRSCDGVPECLRQDLDSGAWKNVSNAELLCDPFSFCFFMC